MAGLQFNQKHWQQINEAIRWIRRFRRRFEEMSGFVQPQRNLIVVLDGDLAAAADKATSPATATGSVWQKDSDGDLVDSGSNITVTNRFENVSISSGTQVKVEWIVGEWQPYAADCDE